MTLTPQFFDVLILAVIIIGSAFAAVRLYKDFTRPLPGESSSQKPPSHPENS